jgi:glycosyltransferase involved in cell wall biosynthesis
VVVHNGIKDVPDRPVFVAEDDSTTTIGIVGQVGEWKGHEDFVAALAILRETGRRFKAAIFGTGTASYVEALKSRLDRLDLSDRVHWYGYVRDPNQIYSRIGICVVPSRFDEPFGLVAAEAGIRGLPVIATRRGGLPEIVVDGETGYVVDSHNPAELAERLKLLLDDAVQRRALGERARARCRVLFTTTRMVDSVERVCASLSLSSTVYSSIA